MNLDELRPFLLAQEKPKLAAWLLEAAERDSRLHERLLREANRASGKPFNPVAYRKAIDRAAARDEFIDYDEAFDFADNFREAAIEPLRELLKDGRAAEVIPLIEHALGCIENALEHADDSNGEIGGLLADMQELHLRACQAARPDPEELAARLFNWELNGHWDVFSGAIEKYASVLGKSGLAAYRALAEARWAALPALAPDSRKSDSGPRFYLTQIMETLARASGDIEALVAAKAKDLSHAFAFLSIAELYRDAQRYDDALNWAERGLQSFPDHPDPRLLEFLADEYHRRNRPDDAMAMAWRQFDSRATLETYHRLKQNADLVSADAWPTWRERALAFLHQRIANAGGGHRRGFSHSFAVADRSTLIEIFLSEHDVESAWREAQTGDCGNDLSLRLADSRAKTHPAEAIPRYLRHAEQLIAQKDNRAYEAAVRLLAKIKALHFSLGQADKWAVLHARLCTEHKAKRNFMALAKSL